MRSAYSLPSEGTNAAERRLGELKESIEVVASAIRAAYNAASASPADPRGGDFRRERHDLACFGLQPYQPYLRFGQ